MQGFNFFQAAEKPLIIFSGLIIVFLGFTLLLKKIKQDTEIKAESLRCKLAISGLSPGILFMLTGGIILIMAIVTYG